ncbi:glycosyltransferase family 8 protein [Scytonema hofmannii FACHB-248]|uniref:Glycosyltransferase family 8 protein n=1 Tax=Scytonema hofmannii FACHB-248 TaxID=1842502 RepID=A0ABR8GQ67_9CYAN|nr:MULTISPECIES: glycosyltransferase family 8 protein [Nostocales]MBD2605195.1 glycosyltransferase family 8 protein [Scytonema hofmannii FACHB-248]
MSVCSNSQPIVLVCAADNNYAMPLAVTVRSALTNIKSNRKIALFIIDGGISQVNKRKIIKSLNSEQIDISWVQPDNTLFEDLVVSRHLTVSAYYRLFIPELLPQKFDKAIYLDSDMVVTGDLEELWNIDVGDNYVLAVQDDHQLYISISDALETYNKLGIPLDYKYFNSGLLVMNLEKWRSENIGKKIIECMKREHLSNDQDGLNAVLAGKWQELHPKWNQMPRIYEYSSWKDSPFPEPVYNDLLHQPQIIHFSTLPKPWYAGLRCECTHPKKDLFFRYLDVTAWSGWRDTIWRRLARKFMKLTSLNTAKL